MVAAQEVGNAKVAMMNLTHRIHFQYVVLLLQKDMLFHKSGTHELESRCLHVVHLCSWLTSRQMAAAATVAMEGMGISCYMA